MKNGDYYKCELCKDDFHDKKIISGVMFTANKKEINKEKIGGRFLIEPENSPVHICKDCALRISNELN